MKLTEKQHTALAAILLYGSIGGAIAMVSLDIAGLISHRILDTVTNYLSWVALWYAGYVAFRQETLRDKEKKNE